MESIDKIHGTFEHRSSETVKNTVVPTAVIKRLPRYHRYLADLLESGKKRISSSELSEIKRPARDTSAGPRPLR